MRRGSDFDNSPSSKLQDPENRPDQQPSGTPNEHTPEDPPVLLAIVSVSSSPIHRPRRAGSVAELEEEVGVEGVGEELND